MAFYLAAIIAATAFLAGCGELSLLTAVEGDQGKEFSLNEQDVHLQSGGEYTLQAQGGVKPYAFVLERQIGSLDSSTGRYTAPDSFENGQVIDVPVNVSDYAGESDTLVVRLYERLSVTPRTFEIASGSSEPQDITVSGGVPDYEYEVNESEFEGELDELEWNPEESEDSTLQYTAPDIEDSHSESFRVYDSIGNRITVNIEIFSPDALRIETVPSGGSLTLVVDDDDSRDFQVTGGETPYSEPETTADSDDIGELSGTDSWDSSSDEFTYTVDSPGTAAIEVTDDAGETASITVSAVEEEPDELSLTPSSVTLSEGGTAEFTAVGGISPYEFEVDPGAQNTFEQVSDNRATFTLSDDLPPPFENRTWEIRVTDTQGETSSSNVHSKSD